MKQITHKTDTYELPFKITCTVSGVTKTYTSAEYINKRIDKAGSLAALRASYVCRDQAREMAAAAKLMPLIPANTPVVVETVAPVESPVEKPIAKQYANGQYRNAKGHIIKKELLVNYTLVPFEKAA